MLTLLIKPAPAPIIIVGPITLVYSILMISGIGYGLIYLIANFLNKPLPSIKTFYVLIGMNILTILLIIIFK